MEDKADCNRVTMFPIGVRNMVHTNDGLSELIFIYVDDILIGQFYPKSRTNCGHYWNVPVNSGVLENVLIMLSPRDHTIRLEATEVDEHGTEIDKVALIVLCIDGDCTDLLSEADDSNEKWSKGEIIGLTFGLVGAIGTVFTIAVPLIKCRERIYNCYVSS